MTRPQLAAVPDRPPRAILYLRQSVSRDDSVSLELQETAGRDYAARMGYDVIDVVSDPGRTGTTLKRRQVQAVIDRISRREAEIIVVWRWSRLSRSARDFAIVCETVEDVGGRVESATEPIDVRTASGWLARGMMAQVAAWEAKQRGEVWKEVHGKRRKAGIPSQGGQRFGYHHERGTGTYTPDPTTGPILAAMYRRYLDGHGFVAIAAWLNEQGVTTRGGKPWERTLVARTLDSGFGAGQLVHGIRVRNTPVTWHPGQHEPVITADEWQAYRRLRDAHRPNYGRAPAYFLSGFLKCGDCEAPMHSTRLGRDTGYGYVCSRWADSKQCRCVTIARHRAEQAVYDWLTGLAADTDAAGRRHAMAVEERGTGRSEVDDIARRITRADERLHRLTMGWTEGMVPDAAYRTSRDEIETLKARLTADLAEAEQRVRAIPERPRIPDGLLALWPDMSVGQRHDILQHLLGRAEVHRPKDVDPKVRSRVTVEIVASWGERFVEDSPGVWVPT